MEEDEPPVPMKTRLRKQAERQRDREREEQRTPETISVSDGEEDAGRPAQWNVEQVFSFISSLPGTPGGGFFHKFCPASLLKKNKRHESNNLII